MDRFRDVTMFVCGLVVGLVLAYSFMGERGGSKVPVVSGASIVGHPVTKISYESPLTEPRARAVAGCLNFVPSEVNAYHRWLGEPAHLRVVRCLSTN